MTVRRRLARVNRRVANPVIGRVVPVMPGFGAVVHRGRRSGREYRTPVMAFREGGRYVFALPYGADSDWVRNVLAAGGGDLLTRGRRLRLSDPRVGENDAPAALPAAVRLVLRRLGCTTYLTASIASDAKENP